MKMASTFTVVVVFLLISTAFCDSNKVPMDFDLESPCSSAGGLCIMKDECSVTIEDRYLNLCPAQKHLGAECCHGVSIYEYRCEKFGGTCIPVADKCPDLLRENRATDCSTNTFCCVLV
ncbi:hypothetical protein FQA39_LY05180 [Lamprigera yunnana]|nr:hypothetical protein FQA39_LY05180 [Lamprigera yunnana]